MWRYKLQIQFPEHFYPEGRQQSFHRIPADSTAVRWICCQIPQLSEKEGHPTSAHWFLGTEPQKEVGSAQIGNSKKKCGDDAYRSQCGTGKQDILSQ